MKQYSYAIEAHPRGQPVEPPSVLAGYLLIIGSLLFLVVGSYATIFSAFVPLKGWNIVLDMLIEDTHYKYFFLLLIPTSAYFVIANWFNSAREGETKFFRVSPWHLSNNAGLIFGTESTARH